MKAIMILILSTMLSVAQATDQDHSGIDELVANIEWCHAKADFTKQATTLRANGITYNEAREQVRELNSLGPFSLDDLLELTRRAYEDDTILETQEAIDTDRFWTYTYCVTK